MGFMFSHKLVGKSMKILMEILCDIECCPLKSNYIQCNDLQKNINHECKSKIISSTTISILAHGWWNNFKDGP